MDIGDAGVRNPARIERMFEDTTAVAGAGPVGLTGPPGPELAGVVACIRPDDLDDWHLVEAIRAWDRLACWAAAGQLAAITELARRRPPAPPGDGDPDGHQDSGHAGLPSVSEFAVDEVAAALRLSRPAAGARLHLAVELDLRLSGTAAALRAGDIDVPKARAVVEATVPLNSDAARAVQDRVLPRAAGQTVGQLRASLARAVLSADPAGAETRHQRAAADRRVVLTPLPDGMAELWALLPADGATTVYSAIDTMARRAAAPGDDGGMDARRADALVDLAGAALDHRGVPRPRESHPFSAVADSGTRLVRTPGRCDHRPRIHLTVPAATVLGLAEEPGELAGYGAIPAAMARRIAAAGSWRRVVTHPDTGAVLDLGRTTYTPSAALADFVAARDRTCRFPGCRQPAHRCDLDHLQPYPDGPTNPDNLSAMCRHHHRLKHQTRWTAAAGSGGLLTWTSPTGHQYTTGPPAAVP